MTSMLLTVSFLLHLITLAAIYQLFKQQQATKGNDSKEIIELMDTYLEEIREENRILEQELHKQSIRQQNDTMQPNHQKPRMASVEESPSEMERNDFIPDTSEVKDVPEMSQQARILQLHNEGLSGEEIARKLNCGKTEVELILKFHTNE